MSHWLLTLQFFSLGTFHQSNQFTYIISLEPFASYNDDPTFNFFHTYGFVDESAGPNPDEEIIFQSCEVTNNPEKIQIIDERYSGH